MNENNIKWVREVPKCIDCDKNIDDIFNHYTLSQKMKLISKYTCNDINEEKPIRREKTRLNKYFSRNVKLHCSNKKELNVPNPNLIKCSKCYKLHSKNNVIATNLEHTLIATDGNEEKIIETKKSVVSYHCISCIYKITKDEFPEIEVLEKTQQSAFTKSF